jgi:NAD-dependent dihydropyrimidine dehydrogenase PreA subunit
MQAPKQEALDLPTLTAYITYARQHVHPTLSSEAADDLVNGYVTMRRKGNFPGSSKKVCQICLIYHLTFEYTGIHARQEYFLSVLLAVTYCGTNLMPQNAEIGCHKCTLCIELFSRCALLFAFDL